MNVFLNASEHTRVGRPQEFADGGRPPAIHFILLEIVQPEDSRVTDVNPVFHFRSRSVQIEQSIQLLASQTYNKENLRLFQRLN